ncbi:MAG: flagellar export chaperone FlgN [Synergistaceae bacterium]|nr:flagellar export chaperone FlgN [Synergistaceae bacterium]
MPTDLFETLNSLAQEELSLYKSLEVLVDEEEMRVRDSDMEGLLDVLQKKQSIISRQESLLEQWNNITGPLGVTGGKEGPDFWNNLAKLVGQNGYNQIVAHINEIRERGQKLLDREGMIRAELEENLAEMRNILLKMGRNRIAMQGYSRGMAT